MTDPERDPWLAGDGARGAEPLPLQTEEGVAPNGGLPDLSKRFFNLRTALSFAMGFAILLVVFSRINVEAGAILARLGEANPWYYLAGLGVYYLTFLVRSLRWRQLLWNVGYGGEPGVRLPSVLGTAEIILLSWFANCVVPAKLGDAYRAYLLKRTANVSFSKTFGTIVAERIMDVLLLVVLMALAAFVVFHGAVPSEIQLVMQVGLVLVVLAVVGLLALRNLGGLIQRLLPHRFRDHYGKLEEGVLASFQALPLLVLYTALAWGVEAGRLYFVGLALGLVGMPLPLILFVALAGALLTTLPFTPAGLGFVETGIVGILLLTGRLGLLPGIDESTATSVAILDRTISYWSLIVFGFVAYVLSRKT